jgi:hypothetical protein
MSPIKELALKYYRFTASPLFNISIIISLWFFASFWNIDKAFHMDDTGHLEIARWIAENPFHPMSGMLSWDSDYQPIHYTNQPHLYFYLMAIWGSIFGWTEISVHLLMSLFTLWAISAFYRIAIEISPQSAIFPTALFAISPAFVVGQNTMVDVPLIAIWLEFYCVLLNPNTNESNRYLLSSILCSVALLVKYTSLVLVPALVFHMIFRKQFKQLVWVVVPIVVLILWSAFNIYDYGGVHILQRHVGGREISYIETAIYWLGILGGITPFAILAFVAMIYRSTSLITKSAWFLISTLNLLTFSLIFWFFITTPSNLTINILIKWLFIINGTMLIILIMKNALTKRLSNDLNITQMTLLYWLLSSAIFIIGLAPFMAARHVLLSVPPIVLLLYSGTMDVSKVRKFVMPTIVFSLLITSMLAMADC